MNYNKEIRVSSTIHEGELTEFRERLYKAEKKVQIVSCLKQCDGVIDIDKKLCNGMCYRWQNGDNLVFKIAEVPEEKYEVVVSA